MQSRHWELQSSQRSLDCLSHLARGQHCSWPSFFLMMHLLKSSCCLSHFLPVSVSAEIWLLNSIPPYPGNVSIFLLDSFFTVLLFWDAESSLMLCFVISFKANKSFSSVSVKWKVLYWSCCKVTRKTSPFPMQAPLRTFALSFVSELPWVHCEMRSKFHSYHIIIFQ